MATQSGRGPRGAPSIASCTTPVHPCTPAAVRNRRHCDSTMGNQLGYKWATAQSPFRDRPPHRHSRPSQGGEPHTAPEVMQKVSAARRCGRGLCDHHPPATFCNSSSAGTPTAAARSARTFSRIWPSLGQSRADHKAPGPNVGPTQDTLEPSGRADRSRRSRRCRAAGGRSSATPGQPSGTCHGQDRHAQNRMHPGSGIAHPIAVPTASPPGTPYRAGECRGVRLGQQRVLVR